MIVYGTEYLFPIRKNGTFIHPRSEKYVKLLELNGQLLYVDYNNIHCIDVKNVETSIFTVEINDDKGIVVEYGATYETCARAKHILAGNIIRIAKNRRILIPSDVTDIEDAMSTYINLYDTVFCTSKTHNHIVVARLPITTDINLEQIYKPNLMPIIYIGSTTNDRYVLERVLTTICEIDKKIKTHALPSGNAGARIWQYIIAITNWDHQNKSINHDVHRCLNICHEIEAINDEQIWGELNIYLENNFPEKAPAYRREIINIIETHDKQ